MGKCKYLEIVKTNWGNIYHICHRPPYGEEGRFLPNGEEDCKRCKYREEE